ncbi:MAG: hypothetical protein AB8G96_15035 [Phycisphaerales bacterium]
MIMRRTLWTAWALVPVGLLAFHIGPGQRAAARDVAARLQGVAQTAEDAAITAHRDAYTRHLETIAARRATFDAPGPAADAALETAIAAESAAYEAAADLWETAAEQHEAVLEAATALPDEDRHRITLARGRALVRSGDVWGGAAELRELVDGLETKGATDDDRALARAAREELAAAHYFGARILRLAGEPAEDWRAEASLARQHYRHLARDAAQRGVGRDEIRGFEDNVERVLDLEQQDQSVLEGMPLPRESPRAARGSRPGNGDQAGKSRRPRTGDQDARGASGVEQIGRGW